MPKVNPMERAWIRVKQSIQTAPETVAFRFSSGGIIVERRVESVFGTLTLHKFLHFSDIEYAEINPIAETLEKFERQIDESLAKQKEAFHAQG